MSINEELKPVTELLEKLIIFRTVKHTGLIRELLELDNQPNPTGSFYEWYGRLLEYHPYGNPWTTYLNDIIRFDENYFTLHCERGESRQIPPTVLKAVDSDLEILLKLMHWDPSEQISGAAKRDIRTIAISQAEIENFRETLATAVQTQGAGLFGRYHAAVWQHSTQSFHPVHHPDPITFDQLIGYEEQKQILQDNTRRFVEGLPANHILLYGDRGSGKSSSVKALLHPFAPKGLRIIEVYKDDLVDFPAITGQLRHRGLKFLIYVDDLTFESGESGYKHLKAILEGSLENKPSNILIYATSNRRHLLRETFADRENDIHGNDTVQEQLSLADRFGITLTYSSPDQNHFLAIVNGLAKQRALPIDKDTLEKRALQWERQHNGRSGRTAKQFIDFLEGELRLKEKM